VGCDRLRRGPRRAAQEGRGPFPAGRVRGAQGRRRPRAPGRYCRKAGRGAPGAHRDKM
ncbi:MAG: hypothetical protein AVDCRST_MAG02-1786, partial [uncultured Rubrobacteraceae bacterium]